MKTPQLFIYGSLAPGKPNEHIMRPIGGTWQRGTAQGELLQEGWGAQMGFPAIKLDTDNPEAVAGWLLASPKLDEHWGMLDDFEGEGYRRRETKITLDDGTITTGWIYSLT